MRTGVGADEDDLLRLLLRRLRRRDLMPFRLQKSLRHLNLFEIELQSINERAELVLTRVRTNVIDFLAEHCSKRSP